MTKVLTADKIEQKLQSLEFNWEFRDAKLLISVETKDFTEAMWVIAEVGQAAEELNHHPDISLRNYNKLTFELSTHSVNGITAKDFDLAERIDGVLTRIKN